MFGYYKNELERLKGHYCKRVARVFDSRHDSCDYKVKESKAKRF